MLVEIRSRRDRISSQFALIEAEKDKVDVRLLSLFANQMALRCAGLVEKSVQLILAEYARRRANPEIARFVQRQAEWENSLNCEKIEKLLDRFNKDWWRDIEASTTEESRLAIDSLKNIRDQLAHGGENGTGLVSILSYHIASSQLVDQLSALLIPDN
jgi:hypothetical protein